MLKEHQNHNNEEAGGLKDEEILTLSLNNPRLFERLVRKYQDSFLRTANRVLNNLEEAQDAVQDAFVKIYFNAQKFKKQEGIEFKSWAFKILFNTALTRYRRAKRTRADAEYNDALAVEDGNLGKDIKRREERDLIESVLKQMPEDLGLILKQHYLEDRAYSDISKENGLTIGAIKMKLFRARKLFNSILRSIK